MILWLGTNVREEQLVLRNDHQHAGGTDSLELGDGAAEFALDGPIVIGPLDEVGNPEVATVEDFEPDAFAGRNPLGSKAHAHLVDLIGRHVDRGAGAAHLAFDAQFLDGGHHRGDVLRTEPPVEELHLGPLGPGHEPDHARKHGHPGHR